MSHTVGKTLGNGHVNEFVLPKVQNQVICPVEGLKKYVEGSRDLGVDLRIGYLFRSLDSSRTLVLDNHVTTSAMSDRLKKYLITLNIYEGETAHSFRAGCGITLMANNTTSSEEIMEHVGWRSRQSFNRYSRINRIVGTSGVGDLLAKVSVLKIGTLMLFLTNLGIILDFHKHLSLIRGLGESFELVKVIGIPVSYIVLCIVCMD